MTFYSQVGDPSYGFKLEKPEWKKDEMLDGFEFPFNFYGGAHTLFRRFTLWDSSVGVCLPGVNWYTSKQVNGVTNIPLIKRINLTAWSNGLIKVGDTVDGDSVIYSENRMLTERRCWQCNIEFGFPPAPQIIEEEGEEWEPKIEYHSEMLENLMEMHAQSNKAFLEYIEEYTANALSAASITLTPANFIAITSPTGGPITPPLVNPPEVVPPVPVPGVPPLEFMPNFASVSLNVTKSKNELPKLKQNFKDKLQKIIDKTRESLWR